MTEKSFRRATKRRGFLKRVANTAGAVGVISVGAAGSASAENRNTITVTETTGRKIDYTLGINDGNVDGGGNLEDDDDITHPSRDTTLIFGTVKDGTDTYTMPGHAEITSISAEGYICREPESSQPHLSVDIEYNSGGYVSDVEVSGHDGYCWDCHMDYEFEVTKDVRTDGKCENDYTSGNQAYGEVCAGGEDRFEMSGTFRSFDIEPNGGKVRILRV